MDSSIEAQFKSAIDSFTRNDFSTAEIICFQIRHQNPFIAENLNLIALISHALKKKDQAILHAEAAVTLFPDNDVFLITLGDIHFEYGDFEKALSCFQAVNSIYMNHTEAISKAKYCEQAIEQFRPKS